MFVRGTGRGVDEEVVERGPEDVGQELADHGCFLGAPPYHGRGTGGEEEGQGGGIEGADLGKGGWVVGVRRFGFFMVAIVALLGLGVEI